MPITVNGNLADWTASDRLETPATLTPNYEVYGRYEASTFYFALKSAVAIGPNTTIWLNTDGDSTTGQLVFGEVGAEYYVNIDADNIARLYNSANTLISVLTSARSGDNLMLELAIPKASIGGTSSVTISADINDSVHLHDPYSSGGFVLSDPAEQPFDGNLTEWTPTQRLDSAGALPEGNELYGKVEGGEFVFGLKSTTVIGSGTTFWLNTDGNTSTGYQIFGTEGGAEYNVNIGVDGVAKLYSGAAGQTFVSNIDYKVAFDGHSMEFSIPKTLLGNTPAVTVLMDVSDQAFLPVSYSSGGFTLIDNSVNPYDGLLTEWTHADRLETPVTTVAGLELYGKYEAGSFVFAVKSSVVIGPDTTFWFNTDGSATTGQTAFGGAEYHVNIDSNGIARLYSGTLAQTPVGVVDYAFGPDHKTLEFAIPKTLIGQDVTAVTMVGDINQSVFFPTSYADQAPYTVIDPASLPTPDHSEHKIAILYSESTAANYFNTMAYSQLFMAAQSQAMAAGVPYDIVTEADLKDLAKMSAYDTIVFPSFTNVKAADVGAIQSVLNTLVYQYNVSLIASGNFMTTDETGEVLPNAYARMQSLFGVEADGSGSGQVDLRAHGTNPITAGYGGAGAEIHTYDNVGTSYYKALAGVATTIIADQVVGGVTHTAVIGTETGGRNVHFATDGFLGDNNLLGQAIDWVNEANGGPTVSLDITRNSSILAARIDMDQSQETFDVDGGIYDKLLPILDQWKAQYNFVGSYYINVGLDPQDGRETNWLISNEFYNHLQNAGNEIGSHSYTHPEDTNVLAPPVVTEEILAALKASHAPDGPGGTPGELYFPGLSTIDSVAEYNTKLAAALAAPDPSVLDVEAKALLESSFYFQFEVARQVIEANFGPITGAAVPGAPESLEAARQMMQYYDYLSGGATLIGAGYPGAFGYLSPTDQDHVYIAPNTSFDFTLLGFQGLTLEQAAAKWATEFASLQANSDVPIVVWPWHDYGPTAWPLDEGVPSSYSQDLFENYIQNAYNSGSEFVTLADLAARIKAFEQSSFGFSVAGDTITMHAVPQTGTLGTFALNLDDLGGKVIQSVTNWYAYDDNSIFLDADGGTFTATLGTTQADVTHITSIGARAQLVSLTGDGNNLDFTIEGEGKVVVDTKLLPAVAYEVIGATVVSRVGDILTLDLGAIGSHTVSIRQIENWNATEGDDIITGNASANNIKAFGGNDIIIGAGGADTIDGGDGNDTASYVGSPAGVTVNLLTNTALGGDAQGDILISIENLTGSSFDDNLTGNAEANILDGGLGGNDTLDGGDGDDTLKAWSGADTMIGGNGSDTLSFVGWTSGVSINLDLTTAQAVAGGSVTLSGIENITGGNGADTLRGSNGVANILNGGLGNDILIATTGADTMIGGDGIDTLSFVDWTTGETISLDLTTAQAVTGGSITLSAIENITGGDGGDTLRGNSGANVLNGGLGDDTFIAWSGADTMIGGDGSDTISFVGWTSGISINLELTTAQAVSGGSVTLSSIENIIGGNGADTLRGNSSANILDGGSGDDTFIAWAGADTMIGGDGSDTISFAGWSSGVSINLDLTTTQAVSGGSVTVSGIENIIGGKGADTLRGSTGVANILNGGLGNDILIATTGTDTMIGGDGIDTLSFAGWTNGVTINLDLTTAQAVTGGSVTASGIENLTGGDGDDILRGSSGANVLNGGLGNDTFIAWSGADTMIGGDGSDTISFVGWTSGISINLDLSTAQAVSGGSVTLSGIENVTGGNGADILRGNAGANILDGGSGNDTFIAWSGNDTMIGGDGTDTLSFAGWSSGVSINLDLTTTQAVAGGGVTLSSIENVIGGNGADTLRGNAGANVLTGGLGNDTFIATTGTDTLNGGDGIDTLSFTGWTNGVSINLDLTTAQAVTGGSVTLSSIENIIGGNGNDILRGSTGANVLNGGSGNDTFIAWSGADTMIGGDGSDTISFAGWSSGVAINLGLSTAQAVSGGSLTLSSIENIIGGAGADTFTASSALNTLTGGAGNDTFKFVSVADSGMTALTRDVITDFTSGHDRIDLSAIDAITGGADNAFSFLAASGADFTAAGQLRWYTSGGNTFIEGNIDGNLTPDFSIQLNGIVNLTSTDFLL